MLILPSKNAPTRVTANVKEMTDRKRCRDKPRLKCSALNAVRRGWIRDSRHCHAKPTAKDLDCWVNRRVFLWWQKRHRLPPRRGLALDQQRQDGQRDNWGLRNGEDWLCLSRRRDQPRTKDRSRTPAKPSFVGDWATARERPEGPLPAAVWWGHAENHAGWRELKAAITAERGAPGEGCGRRMALDLHHVQACRYGGRDLKAHAQRLGEPCPVHTPTSGDHRRLPCWQAV